MRLVLRTQASGLIIESLAPDVCAAVAGSSFRKRPSARKIEGGLPPSGHVEAAPFVNFPFHFGAELPRDGEQAMSYVAGAPIGEAR